MGNKISIGVKHGLFYFIPAIFSIFLLTLAGIKIPPIINEDKLTLWLAIEMVIIAPFVEEFFFRFIPIRLTMICTKRKEILWTVIILSSILFGLVHGSPVFIFIQGISGIINSRAFLKGGYISSVTAHMTVNGIVAFSMLLPS